MRLRIHDNHWRCIALSIPLLLAGCGTALKLPSSQAPARPAQGSQSKSSSGTIPALPPAGSGRGGYYQDDGPGDNIPEGLLDVPDPVPQVEPYAKRANDPYVVFGKKYTPVVDERPFKQRGIGSWYGKKFHGAKTSSGEPYDMYKMTAAHPTLPIPSYARVTNLDNGKQVIVRINDRGPFHSNRIIDLSFTAALKLGYLGKGSGMLEVERLLPDEIARINSSRGEQDARAEQAPPASVASAPVTQDTSATQAAVEVLPVDAKAEITTTALDPVVAAANPVITAAPASSSGFYIQLGAYSQAANAEAARARLMQNWSAGLPPIEVFAHGPFHRLHSGPFATREQAAAAARQLQDAGAAKPMIVQR